MKPQNAMTPLLYPEKSREELELDYHQNVAALRLAATELLRLGGRDASEELILWKVGELLDRSLETAAKSASVRYQRNLMAAATPVIVHCFLFALLLATGAAHGQASRTEPSRTDAAIGGALDAADLTLRTMDFRSTHTLLNSPCRCFYEDDPLSPGGRAAAPLLAFQYGMGFAVIATRRELVHHGHPRLAWLVIAADLASESLAVQRNLRRHDPPLPIGHTLRPTPEVPR